MDDWGKYLEILSGEGSAAAWTFAKKNFDKSGAAFASAQRYHSPTMAQRRESARRRAVPCNS